jgi:hypothetical protein
MGRDSNLRGIPEENDSFQKGGAESGALSPNLIGDPRLTTVVEVWADLSEPLREAILTIVRAQLTRKPA